MHDSPESFVEPVPRLAAALDRFDLLEVLGSGSMGTVYRAHDRLRRADVALKVLHRTSAARLYRFKREFRALSGLVHPNLVTLYELDSSGDTCLFTMELVEGSDFLDWVRPYRQRLSRPLTSARAPTSATAICEPLPLDSQRWDEGEPNPHRRAIERATVDQTRLMPALRELIAGVCALHDAGMLHRDLKPSNVLVDRNGRVLVCDFGLVEHLGRPDQPGKVIWGTPGYMSPEQAAGLALCEASDWYSLGVMLFEALTGRLPFDGTSREVMRAKVSDPAPLVLKYAPDTDRQLAALCDRLLEFEVPHRPSTDELRRFAGLPVASRRAHRASTPGLQTAAARGGSDERESPPLFGREGELATLTAAARRARDGQVTVVLVGGPSGIGKSTLCENFASSVAERSGGSPGDDAFLVLSGSCYERETVPYKTLDALVDALASALLRLDDNERAQVIPPDVGALVRLFPALGRGTGTLSASDAGGDAAEVRRRAFGALRAILKALAAQRPVLLFIDDLQWGDADSAPFLYQLLGGDRAARILLLATYRSEDLDSSPSLNVLFDEHSPTYLLPRAQLIELEGLAPAAATELARREAARTDADADADAVVDVSRLVEQANGHPLFLKEMARSLATGDKAVETRDLDGLVRARIRQLDGGARKLLEFAAVAGRPLPLAVLREASRVKDEPGAIALLCAKHLARTGWRDGVEELATFHDRVRQNTLAELAPERLRRLHRRIGSALEWSRRAYPGEVLEHWLAAGDRNRAAQYAEIAAARAEGALAFAQAVRAYERVLELSKPRGRARSAVLQKLAEMLTHAGRPAEAADRFLEAAHLVAEGEAAVLRGRAAEELIRFGRVNRGINVARRALRSVGVAFPRSKSRIVLGIAWRRLWMKVRGEEFTEREPAQRDAMLLQRLDACRSVAGGLSFVLPIHGAYFQTRSLLWALDAGEPHRMAVALCHDVGFRSVRGVRARPALHALVERASALARRLDSPALLGLAIGANGMSSFLSGQFASALASLRECDGLLLNDEDHRFLWQRTLMTICRLSSMVYLGRLAELRREVEERLSTAIHEQDDYLANALRAWRTNIIWLAAGDVERARQQLALGEPDRNARTFTVQHFYSMLSDCQISLYAGDPDAAWARLRGSWRQLQASMNLRVQSVRIEARYLRARIALHRVIAVRAARAARGPRAAGHGNAARSRPESALLAEAAGCSRRLAREGAPWASACAGLIDAAIASARGMRAVAVQRLQWAIAMCEDSSLLLHARAARYQLERLREGDDIALPAAVADWASAEGIVEPARFLSLFAPMPL